MKLDWFAIAIIIATSFVVTVILDYFLFKEMKALQLFRKNLYLGLLVGITYLFFYLIHLKVVGDVLVIIYVAYLIDKLIAIYLRRIIGEIIGNIELQTVSLFLSRIIVWRSAFSQYTIVD